MTRVRSAFRVVCCLLSFAARPFRPPTTCEHKSHTSTALATGGDGLTSKARTAAAAQRPPAAVVRLLSPYVAHPPASALVWGRGEDSHLRTVGLSVLNWGLCANPTSLAERHAAAGGVRRPWGTAADPILRYRMGPHRGPSAAENVACWGLSCVTPLARRVKVAPVCDQPQPRQAPPGRWGCEAAG